MRLGDRNASVELKISIPDEAYCHQENILIRYPILPAILICIGSPCIAQQRNADNGAPKITLQSADLTVRMGETAAVTARVVQNGHAVNDAEVWTYLNGKRWGA